MARKRELWRAVKRLGLRGQACLRTKRSPGSPPGPDSESAPEDSSRAARSAALGAPLRVRRQSRGHSERAAAAAAAKMQACYQTAAGAGKTDSGGGDSTCASDSEASESVASESEASESGASESEASESEASESEASESARVPPCVGLEA